MTCCYFFICKSLYLSRSNGFRGALLYNYTLDGTKLQSMAQHPNQGCTALLGNAHTSGIAGQPESNISHGNKAVKHANIIFWVHSHMQGAELAFLEETEVEVGTTHFLWGEEELQGTGQNARLLVASRNFQQGQVKFQDLCRKKDCEHVCLSTGVCLCSQGFTLQEDGKSCARVKDKVKEEVAPNSFNAKQQQQEYSSSSVWMVLIVTTVIVFILGAGSYFVLLKWRSGRPLSFENPLAYFQTFYGSDNMRIL